MSNRLDTLNVAAGAEALPLELLQPLDSNDPASTPVRLSGPEQRLIVTPDPGVGDAALLPPSQLLIGKDGQTRSIWPVHLAGWQAQGWQLLSPAPPAESEPAGPEPIDPEPAAPVPTEPDAPAQEPVAAEPVPESTDELVELLPASAPAAGEALLAEEAPDFQAMTKAEIVAFCSATYGVSLDGGMTKAELVQQATGLHTSTNDTTGGVDACSGTTNGASTALLELPDDLL